MGWGLGWGSAWGGSPALTLAATAPLPGAIIDNFAANVRTVVGATGRGGKLVEAGYRRELSKEPTGGADVSFLVESPRGAAGRPMFGAQKTIVVSHVVVHLSYWRKADRTTTKTDAYGDMVLIVDQCEDPGNMNPALTGLREVRSLGLGLSSRTRQSDLWVATFAAEWQYPDLLL